MDRLGVWNGGMFMTMGSTAFLYEIALYWPGKPSAYHLQAVPAEYLAKLPAGADSAETMAFVDRLKQELVGAVQRNSARCISSSAKPIPSAAFCAREPGAVALDQASLDPDGLMNPGALEL